MHRWSKKKKETTIFFDCPSLMQTELHIAGQLMAPRSYYIIADHIILICTVCYIYRTSREYLNSNQSPLVTVQQRCTIKLIKRIWRSGYKINFSSRPQRNIGCR